MSVNRIQFYSTAFLNSAQYFNLTSYYNCFLSSHVVMPIAPVFQVGVEGSSMKNHAEVIVAKDKREIFKTFDDLRGHRWAMTDSDCIAGHSGVLGELKRRGHNANFFGSFLHTKTQREAMVSVLNKDADASAVESSVLEVFRRENPWAVDKIHVLESWGPYTPNPVLFSREVSDENRFKILNALVNLSRDHPEFVESFGKFGITGFQLFGPEQFFLTSRVLKAGNQEQLYPAYY